VPEAVDLKVSKKSTQKALTLLRKLALQNYDLRIQRENDHVHIPLIRTPVAREQKELKSNLPKSQISKRQFLKIKKPPAKLIDLLSDRLPSHALASLPQAIDFIGDIAVVEIPQELKPFKNVVAEAILNTHKRVRTVLSKQSPVSGVYRLRTFEIIGGKPKTQTVHKEHGCIFHVDLSKIYFSPRLSYEHARIASLVREGETMVDMFAGVGPFSILIARKQPSGHIYAIDVNPDAYRFLNKNIAVNRVVDKVTPILGDARQVINERLKDKADRVVMNLPEKAIGYVDAACSALKPRGGVIHYYEFADAPNPMKTARSHLTEAIRKTNRRLHSILLTRIVRGIAPFSYHVAVDAQIK